MPVIHSASAADSARFHAFMYQHSSFQFGPKEASGNALIILGLFFQKVNLAVFNFLCYTAVILI
jgi:hypothetical protein